MFASVCDFDTETERERRGANVYLKTDVSLFLFLESATKIFILSQEHPFPANTNQMLPSFCQISSMSHPCTLSEAALEQQRTPADVHLLLRLCVCVRM